VEVYVSKAGLVCIKQDQPGEDGIVIMLHPEEAREIVPMIERSCVEADELATAESP
jgi:hypothetical protein